MKLALSRWIVVALALVLAPGFWNPGAAEKPVIRIGLEAQGLSTQGTPEGVEITNVPSEDILKGKGLGKYDALVVSLSTFETAIADGKLGPLKKFVDGHRALALMESGSDELRVLDASIPLGDDVPMNGGEELPVHEGSAYLRGSTGTKHVFTNAFDTGDALRTTFVGDFSTWLASLPDFHPGKGNKGTAQAADNYNWAHVYTTNYCYTSSPYGQICYYGDWYRNTLESLPGYDWWVVQMETKTTPGYYLWGSGWRTSTTWMTSNTDYYVSTNLLDQYGPGTQSVNGYTTVPYEVGMLAGILGADVTSSRSTAYSVGQVDIAQGSSPAYDDVYVRHSYWYDGSPTRNPQSTISMWSERVDTTQNGGCYKIPYQNKAQWHDYGSGSYYNTWVNSWRNIC